MYMAPYQSTEGAVWMSSSPCTIGIMCFLYRGHFGWHCSFKVASGVCYHKENTHLSIIRNACYQWLLYIPHCLLELSNTAFSLHEAQHSPLHILTWSSSSHRTHTHLYCHLCHLPFKLSGAQLRLTWVYKLSLYKINVYMNNSPHHLRICSTLTPCWPLTTLLGKTIRSLGLRNYEALLTQAVIHVIFSHTNMYQPCPLL